ncbi:MAG: response regulator transcription factor [Bacteroidota bacterium]
MKILICEDEEILLTALEFRMRKAGFDVLLAKDGQHALDTLQTENVDLIVADIDMPRMTGIELIQTLREEHKNDIPVVVISGLEDDEEIMEALRLGGTDFVAKPFKPAELVLRAKCIFQARALQAATEED